MKNFDEDRQYRSEADRDFQIGGQHFRAKKSVRPEVLVPFEDRPDDATAEETLKIIDELVLNMIEPNDDAADRYVAVRAVTDDAIMLEDLQELAKWLVEVTTSRPTGRPGDSSTGPSATTTTSTDSSSSRDSREAVTA